MIAYISTIVSSLQTVCKDTKTTEWKQMKSLYYSEETMIFIRQNACIPDVYVVPLQELSGMPQM